MQKGTAAHPTARAWKVALLPLLQQKPEALLPVRAEDAVIARQRPDIKQWTPVNPAPEPGFFIGRIEQGVDLLFEESVLSEHFCCEGAVINGFAVVSSAVNCRHLSLIVL